MVQKSGDASSSGIQVIERAARILRTLKQNQSGMSLGQIAEAVELPRSTVQRIVGALQAEQLVIAGGNGGQLRLGPEINALAEATRYNIVENCRLLLSELSQATGETADLSVLRGSAVIFLDQVPGIHRLRTVSSVGAAFPLTTTANGRACLSLLPEEKAIKLAQAEWERLNIAGEPEKLMRDLETIRKDGLAYDLDEHTTGISAIGFAFTDWFGDIHSISVPVPSSRFEEIRTNVEDALRNTRKHTAKIMQQPNKP